MLNTRRKGAASLKCASNCFSTEGARSLGSLSRLFRRRTSGGRGQGAGRASCPLGPTDSCLARSSRVRSRSLNCRQPAERCRIVVFQMFGTW
jgi:hypothetical protein